MIQMRSAILAVIVIVVLVVGLIFYETAVAPDKETDPSTPYPCPQATPELLAVEPVTASTDADSQLIIVRLGNAETITITAESGEVSAPATFPTEIELPLSPETAHHLTVTGKVREIQQGDCTYGGYTLSTTKDKNGDPLTIDTR